MKADYSRPPFVRSLWKGQPAILERREKRAAVKTHERTEKQAARKVAPGCRWPRKDHDSPRHVCVGQLEAAHATAIGMGGDRNRTRTDRRALLTVCSWIHTMSPDALERHGRKWEPLTDKGVAGPVSFWRREPSKLGDWRCVGVESSPGILENRKGGA